MLLWAFMVCATKMLPLCQRFEVPIIVNSDAHAPEYVGRFSEAIELLKEIGFSQNLLLNTNIEKFHKFINP